MTDQTSQECFGDGRVVVVTGKDETEEIRPVHFRMSIEK